MLKLIYCSLRPTEKTIVEIKLNISPTQSRGFYEVKEDIKPNYSYVTTPDSKNYQRDDGLHILSLIDFLNFEIPKIYS